MVALAKPRGDETTMSIDETTRINPEWTVGEFEDMFEGREFKALDPAKDHFLCDWCSKGVPYTRDVTVSGYVADLVLNTGHPKWQAVQREEPGARPLVPLASYCDDCTARLLYFPCEGFAEVRYLFTVSSDRVMHNVEVTDVSPRDDGVPWEPKELTEAITGLPFEDMALISEILRDDMWGPENMLTWLVSVTEIDPRDLVRWDGSLDPKALGQARKDWDQFMEKMGRKGYSRQKFRDHVQEK